jgi:hypothetical protein
VSEITEKTLSLDSARLYRVKTVLGHFLPNTAVHFQNPVEVRSGGRRLGWASLTLGRGPFKDRDQLEADLVFSYETPERLDIEVGSARLFARLEGVQTFDTAPFEVVGLYDSRNPEVREFEIFGIEISTEPSFPGQPALGEAVL